MLTSVFEPGWKVRLFSALLALFACAAEARADKRVALVIGNSAYEHAPRLENPKRDAAAVASALRRLGFSEVIERTDLTTAQMLEELRAFGDKALDADWAVVFYAGHGIQVDGQNYLIPSNAKLRRAIDVEDEAVPLDRVLSKVREARKLRLVMLDACRDNPFASRMEQAGRKRSLGRGLARMEPEAGELVAYAARDGQQADDGDAGHSPYTAALLKEIEKPGVEVNLLFRRVRDAVMSRTNSRQEPYVYGALPAEPFYFKEAAPSVGPSGALPPVVSTPSSPGGEARRNEARDVWQSLKDSTSEAQLGQFLSDYGDTPYARYAQVRMGEIKSLGLQRLVEECDRLAASPFDERRKGEGVAFNHVNAALAVPACRKAVAADAEDSRLLFQMGRALAAKGDHAEAKEWYERAVARGEALAMTNLGGMYSDGHGVSQDHDKARELYERAAAMGETTAMLNLGSMHLDGRGAPVDLAKAREWFGKGADRGDPAAMKKLAYLSLDVARDYATAREWFEKAAARGEADAMAELGALYSQGQGVAQDFAKSREWYEKSAAKGFAVAMTNLGAMYSRGSGVAQDCAMARGWFEKASAAGEVTAMQNLGILYEQGCGGVQDFARAWQWYEKAAANGSSGAMNSLGFLYQRGLGVAQDHVKAREWYEKAVANGSNAALTNLGVLYSNGLGGARDHAKARELFEKAAISGDALAMTNMGVVCEQGAGGPQDYAKAREWYGKAAAMGMASAMNNLGFMHQRGAGAPRDYAKARELYEKAAAAGIPLAMTNLGVLYLNGHGVAQNYARARELFEKAAALGEPQAMYDMGLLYELGKGVAASKGKSREWYEKAAKAGQQDARNKLKR